MESEEKLQFPLFAFEVQTFQLLRNFIAARPILDFPHRSRGYLMEIKIFLKMAVSQLDQI